MRPRVLQLFTTLAAGGMERQTLQLVRSLQESGRYEVYAASMGPDRGLLAELRAAGVDDPHVFSLSGLAHPSTVREVHRFVSHLRRLSIDILHTHDFYTNCFGIAAGVLARTPVRVCSRRELDVFSARQRRVEHLAYRGAHRVLANCRFLYRQLLDEGVRPGSAHLLENSVDPGRVSVVNPDPVAIRSAFGLPPSGPVVSMIANLHNAKKDPDTFARAARMVAQNHPDCTFVLAGAHAAGRIDGRAGLRSESGGGVVMTGLIRDVGELLFISDVCVLSSTSEGLPNSVLEYMAAGKPAVASAVGGVSEIVGDGETGYLVPPGDASLMAARIGRLLNDEGLRRRMGAEGRRRVTARHSPAAQFQALDAHYRELLERTSRRGRSKG